MTVEVQVQVQCEWRRVALTLSPCGKQNQTTRKTGALARTLLIYRLQHTLLAIPHTSERTAQILLFSASREILLHLVSGILYIETPPLPRELADIKKGASTTFDRRPSHRSLRSVTVPFRGV